MLRPALRSHREKFAPTKSRQSADTYLVAEQVRSGGFHRCLHTMMRGRWILRAVARCSCRCDAVSAMCVSRTFHVRPSAKNIDLRQSTVVKNGHDHNSCMCFFRTFHVRTSPQKTWTCETKGRYQHCFVCESSSLHKHPPCAHPAHFRRELPR